MKHYTSYSLFILAFMFALSFAPSVYAQTTTEVVEREINLYWFDRTNVNTSSRINMADPDCLSQNREIWDNFSSENNIYGRTLCSSFPPMIYRIPFSDQNISDSTILLSSMVSIPSDGFAGGASEFWVRLPVWSGNTSRQVHRDNGTIVNETQLDYTHRSPMFNVEPRLWHSIELYVFETIHPEAGVDFNISGGELRASPSYYNSLVGYETFNLSDGGLSNVSDKVVVQNVSLWTNTSYTWQDYYSIADGQLLYLKCRMPLYNMHRYYFTWIIRLNRTSMRYDLSGEYDGLYGLYSIEDAFNDGVLGGYYRWNYSSPINSVPLDFATELMGTVGMGGSVTGLRVGPEDYIRTYIRTSPIANDTPMVFAIPFVNSSFEVRVRIWTQSGSLAYANRWGGSWSVAPDNGTYFVFPFTYVGPDDNTDWNIRIDFLNDTNQNILFLFDGDLGGEAKSINNLTNYSWTRHHIYDSGSYVERDIWFRPYYSLQETEGLWNNTDLQTLVSMFTEPTNSDSGNQEQEVHYRSWKPGFYIRRAIRGTKKAGGKTLDFLEEQDAYIEMIFGGEVFTAYDWIDNSVNWWGNRAEDLEKTYNRARSFFAEIIIPALERAKDFLEAVWDFVLDVVDAIVFYVDILIDLLENFLQIVLISLVLIAVFVVANHFKKIFRFAEILGLAGAVPAMLYASSMFDEMTAKLRGRW